MSHTSATRVGKPKVRAMCSQRMSPATTSSMRMAPPFSTPTSAGTVGYAVRITSAR